LRFEPDQPNVSVVICTRNRGNRIVTALQSVLENPYPALEIVIIDQSTNTETCEAVRPFLVDPRLRYIPSQEQGAGRARNQGLREARGEFVLYTDDDCIVPANWIEKMLEAFHKDPKVTVVFCNVKPMNSNPADGFTPSYFREADKLATNIREKCDARGIGAGMGLRREAALSFGGFDNYLGPGTSFPAAEDGDIALRAILKGYYVYETTQVSVTHDGLRSWADSKRLIKNYWIAIGGSLAKPLRSGHWKASLVIFYESFVLILWEALLRLFKTGKLTGIKGFYYFWVGFFRGLRIPINPDTICFQPR